ncbi:uncharacterized protein OCT59_002157 [Rhizophagus irregularis]|uniref:Uncharacterized protein n=2 Tax=Rhizophagus irregularis TaxID=588596 RepID=A0A915ZYR9_9GLOM|nr:hypothetical protein RirG_205570 [Rhizophagus irregularis DAOM 197198w]UZO10577.1 hypothetical protein OCT59_002157 [Rhizophagus irregularis]GBC47209.1 hypothetical protein RIR_jg37928.t1 [Rhizophagus irregularis DAOM 181602=DAOM 197198]CAB4496098.1 unnamed protein product [Rhizophagus irregularis]CAB5210114.1 unnamed protein product [Rhizophagus irregularis]
MDFLHLSDAATGANGDLLEHHLKILITEFHQTQSSAVYSSFHKTVRFNIGYSKEVKWLETLMTMKVQEEILEIRRQSENQNNIIETERRRMVSKLSSCPPFNNART